MKKLLFFITIFGVVIFLSCHKESPNEPPQVTIQPQVDIPWPSLANSPWPIAQGDVQCTGRGKFKGPREGIVSWTYSKDGYRNQMSGTVIGEQGTIYFTAKPEASRESNRYLHALNPDGTLKWKVKLEGSEASTPMIGAGEVIYVGAVTGPFYAINSDGTIKWKYYPAALNYYFSPTIGLDGTIYFIDVDGMLYALSPDGMLKWTSRGKNGFYGHMAIIAISTDGSILYIPGLDETINAISAETGTVLWQHPVGDKLITSTLVDSDDHIYFIKKDSIGYVICSLNSSGVLRWKGKDRVDSYVSLHMDNQGNIYAFNKDKEILSLDYSGQLRWKRVLAENVVIIPPCLIIGDSEGMIYFALGYGHILAIDQQGNQQFLCQLPDISDGLIMGALSNNGHLYLSGTYQFFCIQ